LQAYPKILEIENDQEAIMENESKHSESVENQFERLGENLRKAVEEAWQSEERKRLSEDVQAGIEEFADALRRTTNEFIESPTGQRMRADVDKLSSRVQEGEVADKVESELVRVLDRLNQKLEEAISSMATGSETHETGPES
jgi:hypothetical protein